MSKKLFVAIFLSVLMSFTTCEAEESNDCSYTSENITAAISVYRERLKTGDIRAFKWDSKNNVAEITTPDGDKVSVTHYACLSLGVDAVLHTSNDNQNYITKKILWLTGLVLYASDVSKMRDEIQKREFASHFKEGVYIGDQIYGFIPNAGYLNIEYSVNKEEKYIVIEVTSSID